MKLKRRATRVGIAIKSEALWDASIKLGTIPKQKRSPTRRKPPKKEHISPKIKQDAKEDRLNKAKLRQAAHIQSVAQTEELCGVSNKKEDISKNVISANATDACNK
ncbi:hypothetical protein MBANPS3_011619 [Mucor bainieri]